MKMITKIKYYFRIFLECVEFFIARVDGKYIGNEKVQVYHDSYFQNITLKKYFRKGYVYYIMDEPIIDPSYYLMDQ